MNDSLEILLLGGADCTVPRLAEGIFLLFGGQPVNLTIAGLQSSEVNPAVGELFREKGIELPSDGGHVISELTGKLFDIVICLDKHSIGLSENSADHRRRDWETRRVLFAGRPIHLHWDVPVLSPSGNDSKDRKALVEIYEDLERRIEILVSFKCIQAFVRQRRDFQRVVDSLHDGMMIHDADRHIYMFNQAAERVTGLSRDDVLGRDCHDVFGEHGVCGGQCAFQDQRTDLPPEREYQVNYVNPDGDKKLLQMEVRPLPAEPGAPAGVLATIRDITEVTDLRWELGQHRNFHGMVGVSPSMRQVFETIRQVVISDYPVLITGESGTGKELVANAIHNESRRKGRRFVPINCGALPENILESELFGHVRGAFTGAIRDKKGRFELADGGTLFLDEVGELTPSFQVKLLRVLQENRFDRVGDEKPIHVDVRIISATNRDPRQMVREGTFREDLYYRLCVVPIDLPPLRERLEDIPLLMETILADTREETGKKKLVISSAAVDRLLRHDWPGNVRELINALRFAAIRTTNDTIRPDHLPPEVRQANNPLTGIKPVEIGTVPAPGEIKARRRGKLTADTVKDAIEQAGGNKLKAAKILGVGRATLYRFLNSHPLN